MHLHWKSFKPKTWKAPMPWTILIQVYNMSSTKERLQNELKQFEKEFIKKMYAL